MTRPSVERSKAVASLPQPTVARFFTINDVLGVRDSQRPDHIDSRTIHDSAEPFGLTTFRVPDGFLSRKWQSIQVAMKTDQALVERCQINERDCVHAASAFLSILALSPGGDRLDQVMQVNSRVNYRIRYISDLAQHGVADRWSSPLTTLDVGQGDCEDYAILKLHALRQKGFAEEDIKLALVHDRAVHQDHAVLLVRVDGRWLVLDNRSNATPEISQLPTFVPLFALDERGVSLFTARMEIASAAAVDSAVQTPVFAEMPAGGIGSLPVLL